MTQLLQTQLKWILQNATEYRRAPNDDLHVDHHRRSADRVDCPLTMSWKIFPWTRNLCSLHPPATKHHTANGDGNGENHQISAPEASCARLVGFSKPKGGQAGQGLECYFQVIFAGKRHNSRPMRARNAS
jgi:hypothetical protein